jgi:hypothetical protein
VKTVWLIALHLNYALIACTVFCLRPFMNALTTHYGTAGDSNLELRENGVADCGKGWVFLGGISLESGEVEGGEYY